MRVQLLWIVAVWASCTALRGTAYSRYESQLPNTPPNHPAVGHKNLNSGGSLNKFGSDFKAAGHKWTIALCQADSDGDGQSNGLELGDPYCVWSVGKKPTRTTQISDPSLSSSTTTAVATPTPPTTKAPPGATPRPSTAAPRVPTAVPSTLAPISNTGFQAAGTGSLSLFRGISMNWTYFEPFGSRRSADDFLEVSFSVASDEWVGFGPSPSAMQGNQVICVVRADGTGACADIQTDGAYGVSDRTPVTQVVSTERNAAGYQMTVRTPAASLGGDLKSLQRAIFSKGAWDPSIDYPLQHASGDYFARKVNFYTGAVLSAARSHYDWFVLLAAVGCVLLSCVVAAVLHARGFIPTPRQSRLLWLAAYATLALLVVAVFIVSAIGYRKDGVNAPWGRALGAAVTFLFFLILWPTTRYIGASHILGISYDKLLPLHVVVGTAIALIMTGHFGWMAVVYAKNGQAALRHQLLGWNTSSTVKPLAGFICWVAMMLMFLPAAALRRVAFGVFKLSHMLFPIVLLFGALHYTPMWIAIAPGLLGYGVELVFRLVHYLKPKQLDNAVFHADARVTELGLRLPPEVAVGPGQYVLVGFSELGPLLHPFSVAVHRDGIARCFVKSSGRWTNRLGEIVASNESLGQVRVLGPFGSLDVPLDRPSRIVCVSGGIGVTPMISILQHLASGPYKAPVAVKFIWVTPNMELVAVLGPIIQEQLVRLRGFATIEAVVHVTRLETTAKPPTELGRSNNREGRLPAWQFTFRCEAGRPNLMQYFSEYEGGDPKAVAAYVCGPAALTESVRALSHYLDINLHTETFEY